MSLASLLVHSCRIDRGIPGMPDPTGHTVKTWPPGETVPCLIQSARTVGISGKEVTGPALGGQVVADVRIYLLPAVVLAEQDKILDVTAGHTPDLYDVQFVESWDYGLTPHKEAFAKALRTGEVS